MGIELNFVLRVPGVGDFAVSQMSGHEAISQLFAFDLTIVTAPSETLPPEVTASAKASLLFVQDGNEVRVVHGVLEEVSIEVEGSGSKRRIYNLRLVPRAWRSTLIKTQQIFMDLSVPEVIQEKLGLVGLKDDQVVFKLLNSYPKREFVVQYREDDVQFIGRLAEHLGIAFHFDHSEGSDKIVFSDNRNAFNADAASVLAFSARLDEPNRIYKLRRKTRALPKVYVVCDYNYRKPDLTLLAKAQVGGGRAGGMVEDGCHVKTVEEAEALAAVRAEELECSKNAFSGETSIPLLSAGQCVTVDGSEVLDEPLLITSVEHDARAADGAAADAATLVYRNRFEAIDSRLTYRPPRTTPKPSISGFVTGVVQGVTGVDHDKYALLDDEGRYIIQFHFDGALGNLNTKASRPVRKAQPFAGASEGMHFPLKPGVEVALAFAGGDPDRPIIVGALPNHVKRAVVTAKNSRVNRIETSTGVVVQFGTLSSRLE